MTAIPLCEDDFVYSTLPPSGTGPLRLLTFKHFPASSTLALSLVDAKQEDGFFAISYAWGRPVCKPSFGLDRSVSCKTHGTPRWTNNKALCNSYLNFYRCGPDGYTDILINGKRFYVQDTVHRLLLMLRQSAEIQQRLLKGEYFWLDAICVNQNDRYETEQQTSIMHEIYKAAQHVFVWLGTANPGSDAAMDFLYHLSPSTISQESVLRSHSRAQFHSEDQFWPLYFLFTRPYWQRTSVIQECLLAWDTTLLCGNRAVPWAKAQTLVNQLDTDHEFCKRHPEWAATPAVKIIQARNEFVSSPLKPSLGQAIQHFLFSQSTYPEDKLIGLLNVSLSDVQTGFNGGSGSVERRVEVINKVVTDSQGRGMDPQTAQEWRYLLACLLGVRGMFPKPKKSLSPNPVLNQSWSQSRGGPAATSMPCPGILGPHQDPSQRYAATSIPMHVVGSFQNLHNAWSPVQSSGRLVSLSTSLSPSCELPFRPRVLDVEEPTSMDDLHSSFPLT